MSYSPLQRVLAWVLPAMVLVTGGLARAAEIHTGSQSTYPHRIQLFDEKKQRITPKSKVPYSPKNTCNKCHAYSTIEKGWHFQAMFYEPGSSEGALPVDDPRPGEPYFVVDEATGTQLPTSYRKWARDLGVSPSDFGMSAFDFAVRFGSHVPGGGPLEKTLDKEGKPKEHTGEKWDASGVLEIDCLMCHMARGYNAERRAEQIEYHNFKWAPTAGAGFGTVRGEVKEGGLKKAGGASDDPFAIEEPEEEESGEVVIEVDYVAEWFDKGDLVDLPITRKMPRDNCLFCHYNRLRESKEGRSHHWIRDIHYEAGLLCTDCHKNHLDHRITRGDGSEADVAREPMNKEFSCEGCHYLGRGAAPETDHPGLPEFHLNEITCTACHSGFEPNMTVEAQMTAIAHRLGLSTEDDLTKRGPVMYGPVWKRGEGSEKIGLYRYAYPRWWGKKTEQGVTPLPLKVAQAAVKKAGEKIQDDNKDGKPEVNTDAEIAAVLAALADGVGKDATPVLVAAGGIYERDREGAAWTAHEIAQPYYWPMGHPVRPVREALGSGGCTDCHDAHEPFYMIKTLVDDDTEPEPAIHSYNLLGTTASLVELGEFREEFVKQILVWIIPIIAGLCLLHYVTFGPKIVPTDEPEPDVQRFGVLERAMHLFLFVAFLALSATAIGFLTNKLPVARGSFWTSHWALELHEIAGFVFAGATVVVTLRWFVTSIPKAYDIEWCKMLGGYLWIQGHPPAGKFNFGQKGFFWVAMALAIVLSITGITMWLNPGGDEGWATIAYTLHDLAGVLLIAFAVVHLYLTTIANPGTLSSIFTGRVTKKWARNHHPNWAEEMLGPGEGSSH